MHIKLALILASLPLLGVSVLPAQAGDCSISRAERQTLLQLQFKQFDQQPGSGWRPLYAGKCYLHAAALLEDYMKEHPDAARKHYMLPFHTGQMFALGGKHSEAIRWMQKGHSDRKSDLIDWNAFVDANIAFLRHDRDVLLKQRSLINQQLPMPKQRGVPDWAAGKKMNLDVVDGFIACFEKPYESAYGDTCRQQGKKLANKKSSTQDSSHAQNPDQ